MALFDDESEEWKKYVAFEKEKRKSIKLGEDVIHLNYFSGIISQDDLLNYEKELDKVGLQFSSYDKNGELTNSLDDLSLITALMLSNTTVKAILDGTITNMTWDAIKHVTLCVYRKMRGKVYTKATADTFEKKPFTFGIKARLDKNTAYEFKLDGSDEIVLKGLDKVLNFLKEQKPNGHYKFSHLTTYDEKSGKWKAMDVEEEIRKIAKAGRKSSKK